MSIFARLSTLTRESNRGIRLVALAYAVVLVLLAVTQLFGFEDFMLAIESFWLPGGDVFANLLAGLIVTAEVFALPFLLGMNVSRPMLTISKVLGWLVPVLWVGLSVWLTVTVNAVTDSGMLGTLVAVAPGGLMLGISGLLGILASYVSLGERYTRQSKK